MAQSSCQAEIHNMNEPTKILLELKLLFRDLNMPLTLSIPIKNDNKGAVDWSKGTTTKKLRWIDLRGNLVCKNVLSNTVPILHIRGHSNLAYIFTKEFRDVTHFLNSRDSFLISTDHLTRSYIPVDRTEESYKINVVRL